MKITWGLNMDLNKFIIIFAITLPVALITNFLCFGLKYIVKHLLHCFAQNDNR